MRLLHAILAASLPITAGARRVQLLPAGEFAARDGRPGKGRAWRLGDEQGQRVAAAMNAELATGTEIVIDYEHQTLHAASNGQPAPAAGWITAVTWQPGKGLMAEVQWTERAQAAIAADEYRYISPVITWDEDSGEVTAVHLAALVNHPALLGMDPAQALSALSALHRGAADDTTPSTTGAPDMKLILAALSTFLGAQTPLADEAAAVAALQAYKAPPGLPDALRQALALPDEADEAAALTAVAALKAAQAPAPAKAAPEMVALVASLQAQVAALSASAQQAQAAQAVDEAIAAGKLTPAQRDQYLELGRKDMAMLSALLAAAPVIPGLAGQSGGRKDDEPGGSAVTALSAAQRQIADQLGIPHADYLKSLQGAAA